MLDDSKSHGLWGRTAPSAPEPGLLLADHLAHVVVIGAGGTGWSTALHLAEHGTTRPRTAQEEARWQWDKAIFPHVKAFYDGYLEGEAPRAPFYSTFAQ